MHIDFHYTLAIASVAGRERETWKRSGARVHQLKIIICQRYSSWASCAMAFDMCFQQSGVSVFTGITVCLCTKMISPVLSTLLLSLLYSLFFSSFFNENSLSLSLSFFQWSLILIYLNWATLAPLYSTICFPGVFVFVICVGPLCLCECVCLYASSSSSWHR